MLKPASEKKPEAAEKKPKASKKKPETAEEKPKASEKKPETAEKQSDMPKEAVKQKVAEKLINSTEPEKRMKKCSPGSTPPRTHIQMQDPFSETALPVQTAGCPVSSIDIYCKITVNLKL